MNWPQIILLLAISVLQVLSANSIVELTDFRLESPNQRQLGSFWNGSCQLGEVMVQIYPQITTDKFMTSTTFENVYLGSNAHTVSFLNSASFIVPYLEDVLMLAAPFNMTCRGQVLNDYAVLLVETGSSWDEKNTSNVYVQSLSSKYNFSLSAVYSKRCAVKNMYGFNCDTLCEDTNDGSFCYTCSSVGKKVCCVDANVNQEYCNYLNLTIVTTTSTDQPLLSSTHFQRDDSDCKNKNLYFWIMIGMSALACVLLICVLILIILLCQRKEKIPKYVERDSIVPYSNTRSDEVHNEYSNDVSQPPPSIPRARTQYGNGRKPVEQVWRTGRVPTNEFDVSEPNDIIV